MMLDSVFLSLEYETFCTTFPTQLFHWVAVNEQIKIAHKGFLHFVKLGLQINCLHISWIVLFFAILPMLNPSCLCFIDVSRLQRYCSSLQENLFLLHQIV